MPMKVPRPKPASRGSGSGPAATSSGGLAAKGDKAALIYDGAYQDGDIIEVSVEDIDPNPFNHREMRGLDELAQSIKETGLLHPVTLISRRAFIAAHPAQEQILTKEWVLGPGEHRWRATIQAGLTTIRGAVRDSFAPKVRSVLLLENLHRANPSPIEEARQVKEVMDHERLSFREVAGILKRSTTAVHKSIQLLQLPEDVAAAVHQGLLPPTHARDLLVLGDPDKLSLGYRFIAEEGLKPGEAVARVMQGEVPAVSEDPDDGNADDAAPGAASSGVPHQQDTEGPPADGASPNHTAAPRRAANEVGKQQPYAAEREIAAADRDSACWSLLERDNYADPDQTAAATARALLVPYQLRHGAARAKAHAWLRKIGKLGIEVSRADSYHEAVLSSGDPKLIARVAFATALAASEIRAADRRRSTWDKHDAAHVQLLIETTRYQPQTGWETRELRRFHVEAPPTEG